MLMQGEIPPQMNVASSRRVIELFGMLQTKVRESAEKIKPERDNLAACSSRVHRSANNGPKEKSEFPFLGSRLINIPEGGYDEGKFFEMPGVNPLDMSREMFSKQLFEKCSGKPEATISKPGTLDV